MPIVMKSNQVAGLSIVAGPAPNGVGITFAPLESHRTSMIVSHNMTFAEFEELLNFLNSIYQEFTKGAR